MKQFFLLITISILLKLLLIPSYFSTDFEVHRNWLRITFNLPVNQWYFDEYSLWTLDYPPFFAYFEYLLSQFANIIDPYMIHVKSQNFINIQCLYFQRITIILSEIIFIYSIKKVIGNKQNAFLGLIFLQFGFLLVDNIHFQYNTMLQGILILTLNALQNKNQYILSAIYFSVLLNFKHIFLYAAPVIFFKLLRSYCMNDKYQFQLKNFIKLGLTVISVFLMSFSLFLSKDQITQILSRMFPFQRGLVHAYWAPNIWSLYCFLDKMLVFALKLTGIHTEQYQQNTLSSGVVQVTKFSILPEIPPYLTIILIIITSLPLWIIILKNQKRCLYLLTSCQTLIFFMFGYHVHEKAILISINLLQISSFTQDFQEKNNNLVRKQLKLSFIGSFIAGITLMPLLPQVTETPLKICLFAIYHILYYTIIIQKNQDQTNQKNYFNLVDKLILLIGIFTVIFDTIIKNLLFGKNLEFLPLMLYSVYGGFSNIYLLLQIYSTVQQNQQQQNFQYTQVKDTK